MGARVVSVGVEGADDDARALRGEGWGVAPVCVVVELGRPERNVDLRAHGIVHLVERLAGKEHYARFRNFARLGFLRGVAARAGVEIVREEPLMAGSLVLALCRKA